MRPIILLLSFFLVFCILLACEELLPTAPLESEVLDGPIDGLSASQLHLFLAGDEAFNEVFTPAKGLGPYFVAASCASCHRGDGKGHPSSRLLRFGNWEDGRFNPLHEWGGPQLQHRAIPGFIPETLPERAYVATRLVAPAITGLGLLAAVPDPALLAMADPDDQDGDGISGRAHFVFPPDYFEPLAAHQRDSLGRFIGRFGKKANAIDLLQQTVTAYKEDMGITSDFDGLDPVNPAVSQAPADAAPDPEAPSSSVQSLVFYLHTLKPPLPRHQDDPQVMAGKAVFQQIRCSDCHQPVLHTGAAVPAVLANREFYPYTDLLLHDMGPELDDGYTEGDAASSEWRTPPLWGLGLSADSQGGSYFLLHDGRARTIEEAILLHGGEAAASRELYRQLSQAERRQLLTFLESL